MATTKFNVTKAKKDSKGQTHFQQVGKIVIRENGRGVLFLHFLDGDYVLFPATAKAGEAAVSRDASNRPRGASGIR
jgi:hypothetical protein